MTNSQDSSGNHSIIAFHGTDGLFDHLDPSATTDGGLHFGTKEQAIMRSAGGARTIFKAHLNISKPQRSKDLGGKWAAKIKSAKAAGKDSIVYLNRYEGMSTEIIERLQKQGLLEKIDGMTDAQFKKLIPEACDSYIIFSADQVDIISTESYSPRPRQKNA